MRVVGFAENLKRAITHKSVFRVSIDSFFRLIGCILDRIIDSILSFFVMLSSFAAYKIYQLIKSAFLYHTDLSSFEQFDISFHEL